MTTSSHSGSGPIVRLTRFSLRHRRLVAGFWLVLTVVGIAFSGRAFDAFSDQYSVPGREGYQTNTTITQRFGNGGNSAPIVAVVSLPGGTTASATALQPTLREIDSRIAAAVPGVRIASYASTHSPAFVSRDRHTTFVVAYAPPQPGAFGQNPQASRAVTSALAGIQIPGGSVHVTGLSALDESNGQKGGLGILAEALLGGLGALLVLAFVFARCRRSSRCSWPSARS